MDQTEKLLIGIENILSVASDLVHEVDRLKRVEEECQILKEKLFLKQLRSSEQDIFTLALDGHSITEMQNILFKEESTIKNQRRSILQKLNVSSMKEAIDFYKKTTQTSSQNFTNYHQEIFQKLVKTS
ncbi:LuxR C-terminal-related transcriptional regulator [Priestia aryabhattai]|uniref:LuxR C-terminal-related transcriptional regulator n=2 Tax=Bacillaceae TaxID=186817 RepID=A0ABD5KZJ6_PRIAR|nr:MULTISPECIES: LuxR C-terminal-related transcriptional regulator [Priestia]MBK0295977.1 LuxR family transcriptional regulator [Bacillus sp. S34]MED3918050.1 LuxR C-terminal-related transcriptional regulator [Priestia aryabhattai]MED4008906.1 LuxR C-terminal-related transcriptional regulator [Priestia aryabhattai]PGA20068.1 LuxR family transcriptional regulator [Priestia aryabhattai]